MNLAAAPFLDTDALLGVAHAGDGAGPCSPCAALVCPGWESMPGGFDREALHCVDTLRRAGDEEPTLEESHPDGTRTASDRAPIAPAFFPYNRCTVWQCGACQRAYLRYTEYGGYYVDERVRRLDPALVTRP